ncbi:hypothetical protein F511_28990 [Dorcoceras hygrometricum]|uniref:Uncharacterized protein n=1 Tax=Dorcoceras hygrometricum TaxID=472368 RepID=A0A2Z7AKZ8_9LAMI|nr:hypothetical protein F511_28990 [Dorcoceras hygrometricum]
MQMLCKGSRLQPKAGSPRIATTAQQQGLIKGKTISGHGYTEHMGATHSSPVHHTRCKTDSSPAAQQQLNSKMQNRQLHLLLPTHEMWELPTPLIAANKPSREMRYRSYPLASEVYGNYPLVLEYSILVATMTSRAHRSTTCSTVTHNSSGNEAQKTAAGSYELHQRYPTYLTQQKALNKLRGRNITYPKKLEAKSDAYANRLHKGDVFAHLTSFKQTFENNIQAKRLSKRSPTLPLLLSSELSTVSNRRR